MPAARRSLAHSHHRRHRRRSGGGGRAYAPSRDLGPPGGQHTLQGVAIALHCGRDLVMECRHRGRYGDGRRRLIGRWTPGSFFAHPSRGRPGRVRRPGGVATLVVGHDQPVLAPDAPRDGLRASSRRTGARCHGCAPPCTRPTRVLPRASSGAPGPRLSGPSSRTCAPSSMATLHPDHALAATAGDGRPPPRPARAQAPLDGPNAGDIPAPEV